jgi:hypothetical protein
MLFLQSIDFIPMVMPVGLKEQIVSEYPRF